MKCQINTSLLPLCLKACSAHYPSLPEEVPKHPAVLPFFSTTKNPQASCQSIEPSAELEEHFKLEVHPSPADEYPQNLTAWGMMPHSSAAGKPQLWRNTMGIPGLSNQIQFDAHSCIKGKLLTTHRDAAQSPYWLQSLWGMYLDDNAISMDNSIPVGKALISED